MGPAPLERTGVSVEIRNPKSEIRRKHECRSSNERPSNGLAGFGLRTSDFLRYSAFGIRYSAMLLILPALLAFLSPSPALANGDPERHVIVAVGAPGEEEFGKVFAESAQQWVKTCGTAGVGTTVIGLAEEDDGREKLKAALQREAARAAGELWIVFLGHGTFDGREARFNLRGDDVLAGELAEWLAPVKRPLVFINCASASAPFLNKLSGPGRVIITATRAGSEGNYARFGKYFSAAIGDAAGDLDKDGQTSLLEAFLAGARATAEFYETEGRLATEHALIDDNGDGLGTQADWFKGIRAVKRAKAGAAVDGLRAHQIHLVRSAAERALPAEVRAKRDELELQLAQLRDRKTSMSEDDYYAAVEKLMLELAKVYEHQPEKAQPQGRSAN
jgi:hypothetical protein